MDQASRDNLHARVEQGEELSALARLCALSNTLTHLPGDLACELKPLLALADERLKSRVVECSGFGIGDRVVQTYDGAKFIVEGLVAIEGKAFPKFVLRDIKKDGTPSAKTTEVWWFSACLEPAQREEPATPTP